MTKKPRKNQTKRSDLGVMMAMAGILCVSVSMGQILRGEAPGGTTGNAGSASSMSAQPCTEQCSSASASEEKYNSSASHSEESRRSSSMSAASSAVSVSSRNAAVAVSSSSKHWDNSSKSSKSSEQWYTSKSSTESWSKSSVSSFVMSSKTSSIIVVVPLRSSSAASSQQSVSTVIELPVLQSETKFYEEMNLRFRGEELRAEQQKLADKMAAAIDHLNTARAEITDPVALERLAYVTTRIDALRVSLSGQLLTPADRATAEESLRLLLDAGLGVVRDALKLNASAAPSTTRTDLMAIMQEMTFLIESAPAVFGLAEQYGVDVPDASYIAYVQLKALLEQAQKECVNARCPLLPRMVAMMENDLQRPLLQAMEQSMEPQEVFALLEHIEDLMVERRMAR